MMGMDMGMPEPDADESGGPSDADADNFTPKDDFEREAADFLDDSKPMGERVMALREAIKLCGESDYGSEPGSSGGEKKKGGVDLLLAFGGPKKSKG
jgi:hypothetical protein